MLLASLLCGGGDGSGGFWLMILVNFALSFVAGMPFNQLGTLAGSKYYNVEATYCYLRW